MKFSQPIDLKIEIGFVFSQEVKVQAFVEFLSAGTKSNSRKKLKYKTVSENLPQEQNGILEKLKYKTVPENLPREQSGILQKIESTRLSQKTCLRSKVEFSKKIKYKTVSENLPQEQRGILK